MSDKATSKSGEMWLYAVGLLVALPLLYASSIGPVFVLMKRRVISNDVMLIYAPLNSFGSATGTDDAFKAYISVWLYLTGTPIP